MSTGWHLAKYIPTIILRRKCQNPKPNRIWRKCVRCRAMKTKGMVFRYTWVYSKEDTMAHTRRPVVTSWLMARSAYETLYKGLMNINESGCWPYGLASALIVIGVSTWYPDIRAQHGCYSRRILVVLMVDVRFWKWIKMETQLLCRNYLPQISFCWKLKDNFNQETACEPQWYWWRYFIRG